MCSRQHLEKRSLILVVTVCIPVYNEEQCLPRCLEALTKQGEIKVICANNDSTDKSEDIMADFGVDKILQIERTPLTQENFYRCRKALFNAVDTEFLFSLDADVVLPEGAIQKCLDMMYGDMTIGAVCVRYGGHENLGSMMLRTTFAKEMDIKYKSGQCECRIAKAYILGKGLKIAELKERAFHIPTKRINGKKELLCPTK